MESEITKLIEKKSQTSFLTGCSDPKKLKAEVLSFIEENQSFQGILSETYETEEQKIKASKVLGQDVTCDSFVCDCIHVLRSQAKRASCSLDLLAAESLSKKLYEEVVAASHGDSNQFLNEKQKGVVFTMIQIIKALLSENSFNRVHFAKCLSSEHHSNGRCLPLEVLWMLHTCHIISFNTYLACCSYNSASCDALIKGLIDICSQPFTAIHDKQIALLSVFLSVLIPLAYKERTNNDKRTNLEKVADDILNDVIEGSNCDHPRPPDTDGEETNSSRLEIFEVTRSIHEIPEDMMSRFFADQMHKLLFKTSESSKVSYAVMNQNKWNFSSLLEHTRTRIQQFLYMFKPTVVMDQLVQSFSRKEVDWPTALSFLAVFLVCEEEAANLIKDYTDGLLNEVITSCDTHSMSILILVIRQSALEGAHVFPSYLTWFKSKFGDLPTCHLNNKKNVQFFFQFLTDLVPYEPAYYLKVHIIKSPLVPTKLRTFVHDYSALARTRLMDLKEPVELVGDYEHSVSTSLEEKSEQLKLQEQANKEVENVLSSYQKTGKVPGSVMEASIFRKPYFIGRFLPTLLAPRKLLENPDTRSKLIKTLSKAGKIPRNMLDAYYKACVKMAFDHDDTSSEDDTSLSDMDKLNKNLKSLTNDIMLAMKYNERTTKSSVSAKLSLLSGHIKSILNTDASQSLSILDCLPVTLDVQAPCVGVKSIQIVDAVLNTFCRTCAATRTADCNQQSWHQWCTDFVTMIASIPAIHSALYFRLWDLLCSKGALTLNIQHTQGLASFLCYLSSHQHQMTPVLLVNVDNLSCSDHNSNNFSFVELIFSIIPLTSCQWMEFNIRLCSAYLQHAAIAFTDIISFSSSDKMEAATKSTCIVPTSLMKKLWYLMHRFSFAALSRCNSISFVNTIKIINVVRTTSLYKRLCAKSPKVSLSEWLTWESLMDRDQDIFSTTDRYHYHDSTVLGHFLHMDQVDGGCNGSYRTACTTILDRILDSKIFDHSHKNAGRHSKNTRNIGAVDLVHLLERIIQFLPQQQDKHQPPDDTKHSWLLQQYYRRVEKVKKESEDNENTPQSLLLEIETKAFTELMVQLPSHLLFCNTPEKAVLDLSQVAAFINGSLRVHNCLSCCLPLNLTAYLMKGIITVSRCENSSNISTTVLKQFCKECPLFFVSIQYYWDQVSVIISCLSGNQATPSVLRDAEAVHKWMSSFCSGSTVSMATLLAYPSWIIASCIFLHLQNSQDPVQHIQRLSTSMDSVFMNKIAVCMFACILSSFAETALQGDEISDNQYLWPVAMELLRSFPDVLVAFLNDRSHPFNEDLQHLRNLLVSDQYNSLLPVVFFSLFTQCEQSVLKKVTVFPQFPQITISMNQKFTQLRKMCLENQAYRSCEKPFQLDFARKVLQFLSHHVKRS